MVRNIAIGLFLLCSLHGYGKIGELTDSVPAEALDEVVITGINARQRVSDPRLGVEKFEMSQLGRIPSFAGERDIIKSISLLPGVRSEGDGGGGFEVRGGNASQNLVLLDGMTLYNPAHVMGIFSTFNDEALGSATLYKGPMPAMYGDATASVLETSLRAGNMNSFHGAFSVGLLAAKIMMQGPVIKDKLSVAVTGRRSYVDAFLQLVPQYRSTVMNFYDVTAKIRYNVSAKHRLDGSFFVSRDNMAIKNIMGLYWGNMGASVDWLARTADNLTFSSTAAFTHYNPDMSMSIMDMDNALHTFIHDYKISMNMRWRIHELHSFDAGIQTQLFRVKSAEWTMNGLHERELKSLWENSVWGNYSGSLGNKIEMLAGLRMNLSSALSGRKFSEYVSQHGTGEMSRAKTYVDVQPRVNLKYNISTCHVLKAGCGVTSQNLHAIRANTTSFPFDRYALISDAVKPETAIQYGIGYNGMTESGSFDWSVEGYYKNINHVYDFIDGKGMFSDIILENIILGGKGRSDGLEFMLRKNSGNLTGWIAYTISHTQTRISGINEGKWYNASNDRRHDLSVTLNYRFSERWSVSGAWIYLSGQPLTAPDVKYIIGGHTCYYYSRRNAYITPSTHRLDLAATYIHSGEKFTYEWSFGLYNAYCRYNPFIVYFEDDDTKPSGTRAVQQSMYGIVPSVSYTLRF